MIQDCFERGDANLKMLSIVILYKEKKANVQQFVLTFDYLCKKSLSRSREQLHLRENPLNELSFSAETLIMYVI